MSSPTVYAARWVLPIDAEWVDDGEVVVEGGIVQAIRPRRLPASDVLDFGNAVILPGLVNAHTHLEYTVLRGFLEDVSFFPWVRALTASKSKLSRTDWLCSARLGALEMIAGGVTTIGDNTDAGVSMDAAVESGLRARIYQEVFGIDDRQSVTLVMEDLAEKLRVHQRLVCPRVQVGVSPHALYTVRPALFDAVQRFVAAADLPTSIHVAESPAESKLTELGRGPFAEMLDARGITWDVPHTTPTRYAFDCGALNAHSMAIHCVHQTPDDHDLLARSGSAVVHCPKSNAKLGAGLAPLARWLRIPGLRVALGTDSAVSNNSLDMWEEMRFALLMQRTAENDVLAVTAPQILRAATLGGAEALGIADRTGSLTPGKQADLIAVRLDSAHTVPATDPYAALVYSARADDVAHVVCDGQTLYRAGSWLTLDASSILSQATDVRQRISRS